MAAFLQAATRLIRASVPTNDDRGVLSPADSQRTSSVRAVTALLAYWGLGDVLVTACALRRRSSYGVACTPIGIV